MKTVETVKTHAVSWTLRVSFNPTSMLFLDWLFGLLPTLLVQFQPGFIAKSAMVYSSPHLMILMVRCYQFLSYPFWLVVLTILKNISQWEG